MRTVLRILLKWLDGLYLPPGERYEAEASGGLADRELDGLGPGTFETSTAPRPAPGKATGSNWPASIGSKPSKAFPAGSTVISPSYQAWEELVLLLFSGRAPEGLKVEHELALAKLRIRSLPAGMTVQGSLDLRQCQRLNHIGDGLIVWGDLLIGGKCPHSPRAETFSKTGTRSRALQTLSQDGQCPLSELPSGLWVARDLRLRQCRRLKHLPGDLQVGRSIQLEGCTAMASLPEPWVVHGDLTVSAAPNLISLPAGLHVEGSLRLIGVRVERLPADLRVGGDLILECCPRLTSLPERLEVGGSLVVGRCPIVRLPSALRVGRDLKLHCLRDLAGLPEGLSVPGRLELVRCPLLQRIPPGLRVGSDLIVRLCDGVRELPQGLVVPGRLDLRGCTHLEGLPAGLNVGSELGTDLFAPALRLADCPALTALPDDLTVGGPIEVAGAGLRELPDGLSPSVQLLWRGVIVPPEVVFRPETLTPERILGQRNAELRRVMLERVGLDAVLQRARAEVVDRDQDSGGVRRLVRIELPRPQIRPQNRCYLHCRCPSTGRDYLLRVPPETRTCREAAAWLAGFDDPEAYHPVLET